MTLQFSSKLLVPLLCLCIHFAAPAFSSNVFAQTNSIVEIGTGILDHDRVEGSRWQRIDFDPLTSGSHTIRIVTAGEGDIRFSLFNADSRSILERGISGFWTGQLDESQSYYLIVWSLSGVANFTATIETETVEAFPELSISTQPADLTVNEGDSATLSVVATGSDPLSYQWLASTMQIDADTGTLLFNPAEAIVGETSNTLTINAAAIANDGSVYFVTVTDSQGEVTTSDNATLSVNATPVPLSITTQPTDLTVSEGESAVFSVVATGSDPLSYQWFTRTTQTDANTGVLTISSAQPIDGETSQTLTLDSITLVDNESMFYVAITDSFGELITSESAILTVEEAEIPLSILTQPADTTVADGEDAIFSVEATGREPLSYLWFANDTPLDGADGFELIVNAASNEDNGIRYSVKVSDAISTITSDAATLTVTPNEEPEENNAITISQFGQGTLDSERNSGPRFIRLHFDSLANAVHTVRVSWDSDADVRFNIFDAAGARLNAATVQGSNPGVWSGVLQDNEQHSLALWSTRGIANFTATVEATIPLEITRQPVDLRVVEGDSASFSVNARSSGNIAYQWFLNDAPLTGETAATLIVPAVSLADSDGQYTVSVSDGSDTSITSNFAQLIVVEPTSLGLFSQEPDESTWVLNGPAPTLDFNVSNENAAWGRVLLRIDNLLLVGGDFNGIRPAINGPLTDRPWLAAFDAVTGQPLSTFQVPPEIDSVVRTLALSPEGNRIYVGGDFGLLALDTVSGALIFSLDVEERGLPGRVFDIAVSQTQIYFGGEFTSVDNSSVLNIARLSLDGELDQSWKPRVTGGTRTGREAPVQAVTLSPAGDIVYVGGNYAGINNVDVPLTTRDRGIPFLTLDTSDGSIVRPERFIPNAPLNKPLRVRDIAVTENYVIIAWGGPNFMTFHLPDGTRLTQYEATGDVQSLQVVGDRLFVGHHGEFFGSLGNPIPPEAVESIEPEIVIPYKLHSFRIDDPSFPPDQTWQIRGFFGVWGIAAAEDGIWISGQITAAGTNDNLTNGLVRFPAIVNQ